jgi:hypothetical protein
VTTDPGRALITGEWQDVGRFKGPVLWGLNFYDVRFELNLTQQQKADLVAFLRARWRRASADYRGRSRSAPVRVRSLRQCGHTIASGLICSAQNAHAIRSSSYSSS